MPKPHGSAVECLVVFEIHSIRQATGVKWPLAVDDGGRVIGVAPVSAGAGDAAAFPKNHRQQIRTETFLVSRRRLRRKNCHLTLPRFLHCLATPPTVL